MHETPCLSVMMVFFFFNTATNKNVRIYIIFCVHHQTFGLLASLTAVWKPRDKITQMRFKTQRSSF